MSGVVTLPGVRHAPLGALHGPLCALERGRVEAAGVRSPGDVGLSASGYMCQRRSLATPPERLVGCFPGGGPVSLNVVLCSDSRVPLGSGGGRRVRGCVAHFAVFVLC